jgi:hypothetical protein
MILIIPIIITSIASFIYITTGNPEYYYIIISALLLFSLFKLFTKEEDGDAINIFFGLFVYAFLWGMRVFFGFTDDTIKLSDYIIGLTPIIVALVWHIWEEKDLPKDWIILAIGMAFIIHVLLCEIMDATDNEFIFILSAIACIASFRKNKAIKYVLLSFCWYQLLFSISGDVIELSDYKFIIKLIGITPYIIALSVFNVRLCSKNRIKND